MKFTKSKDGSMRTNVRITLRFTKEEIEEIKILAKKDGNTPWRIWLENYAALGIEEARTLDDGRYMQTVGKLD